MEPAVVAVTAAAAYGAVTGALVRARVESGVHRRYDDEWTRPLPSYPFLPWILAVTAALLAWRLGPVGLVPATAYVVLTPLYGALAAVDLDVHRLPDRLTLPAHPLVASLLGVAAAAQPGAGSFVRAALAGGVTWAGFAVLHVVSGGQLGRGDVKLAGPLGALVGWFSWEQVAVGVYGMFLVGGAAAVWQLLRHRAYRRSRLAFGPAMILGALLGVLVTLPLPA